ncbi:hypothetical protein Dsin_020518 [Dipteronia sinensis]|uniref:Cardiomyopathy-associated protein 5 n=1 Tax=Dipteronia sinensis TaxID=43782 RepID=A0AAE0E3K3_9ROSI|nr:hypothetical protein Dsin_020518 [Dipteronia sinensis]
MGIDAKCIGDFLWKITRVSMKFCYTCVKKYPIVAGVLLVFFLLFIFLPSVFWFLIYSSPIVIMVTVSIQIYLKIKRFKLQNEKKNAEEKPLSSSSSVESNPVVAVSSRKVDKPFINKQLSRRRNPKQNIELVRDVNGGASSVDGNKNAVTDAQRVQAKNILVGKSEVFIADKGIGLSDGGEIAGLNSKKSSAAQNDLKGKTILNHEKSKGVVEEKGESSSRNIEALDLPSSDFLSHYGSIEQSGKFSLAGGEAEVESSDGEDDDEEEEAQQDGNKAVEWNEDDQRNLMDLGDSELERNKRLESLIAKRKARKLFKMAIEKKMMESGNASSSSAVPIPPIFTMRNNLLSVVPNCLDESLPMPGSAPSILLPSRNPFDLPYDPQEEKPNLMADSFQQEFMAAQQKDVHFCRHESFCLGPSLISESQQDQHDSRFGPFGTEKKNEDVHRFSRFRSQSYMSSHDQLIDELLFQEDEALSRSLQNMSATDLVELEGEVSKTYSGESKHDLEDKRTGKGKTRIKGESMEYLHDMETDSAIDNSTDQCSMASSEASELSFSSSIPTNIELLEAKVGKFPQRFSDRVQGSLTFSVPNSMSFDGSSYELSPSGTDKPPRLGDRLFYREKGPCHSPGYSIASDLQVEVSEVGSPPFTVDGTASPADAESLYDGDIDKDIIASGSEDMWGASCHLAGVDENESRSRELVHEVSEDDVAEVGFSAIRENLEDSPIASSKLPEEVTAQDLPPENGQEHSENLDETVSENVIRVAEEVLKSSQSSDQLSSENLEKEIPSMKDTSVQPPHEKEPLESAEKSAEEVKVINDVGDQVVHENNEATTKDPSQSAETSTSESTDNNSDKPSAENQPITELEQKIEDIMNSENIEGEPGTINEHEDIGGTSRTIEGTDNLESVQESNDEHSIAEVGVNRTLDDPFVSAQQSELVAEQIPANESSSPSSPRSVLPGNITTDQIPSSSYDQLVHHIDVPRSIVDDIFRTNSLDEESPEDLTMTAPENLQQLLVDPTDHPTSTITDSGNSEETLNSQAKSTGEANIDSITNPVVDEKEDEEKLKSAEGSQDQSEIDIETSLVNEEIGEVTTSKSVEDIEDNSQGEPENVKRLDEFSPTDTAAGKEPTSPPGNFTGEADTINNIENPVAIVDEDSEKLKSVEGSDGEGESDNSNNIKDPVISEKEDTELNSVEVIEVNHGGETEKSENEPATKPSIPDSETAEEKEPSDPLPQKSEEEELDIIHHVNETAADEMSNNQDLIQQKNAENQPTPNESNDQSVDTAEVIENEQNDPNEDNQSTVEQSKPIESEVKASSEQESNTAV